MQHQTRTGNWVDDQSFTTYERAEAVMVDAQRYRLKGASEWRVDRRKS